MDNCTDRFLLNLSTSPSLYGLRGMVRVLLIPSRLNILENTLDSNFLCWSLWILLGAPNLLNMPSTSALATASASWSGNAKWWSPFGEVIHCSQNKVISLGGLHQLPHWNKPRRTMHCFQQCLRHVPRHHYLPSPLRLLLAPRSLEDPFFQPKTVKLDTQSLSEWGVGCHLLPGRPLFCL